MRTHRYPHVGTLSAFLRGCVLLGGRYSLHFAIMRDLYDVKSTVPFYLAKNDIEASLLPLYGNVWCSTISDHKNQ